MPLLPLSPPFPALLFSVFSAFQVTCFLIYLLLSTIFFSVTGLIHQLVPTWWTAGLWSLFMSADVDPASLRRSWNSDLSPAYSRPTPPSSPVLLSPSAWFGEVLKEPKNHGSGNTVVSPRLKPSKGPLYLIQEENSGKLLKGSMLETPFRIPIWKGKVGLALSIYIFESTPGVSLWSCWGWKEVNLFKGYERQNGRGFGRN